MTVPSIRLDHRVIASSDFSRSDSFYRRMFGAEVLAPRPQHQHVAAGVSVYFGDPDGSLLEFISYLSTRAAPPV